MARTVVHKTAVQKIDPSAHHKTFPEVAPPAAGMKCARERGAAALHGQGRVAAASCSRSVLASASAASARCSATAMAAAASSAAEAASLAERSA